MKVTHDGTPIAAWLVTCNPKRWDLPGLLASGVGVSSWRLSPNYRARLMEPGDRCFLWLGDSSGAWESGVWGVGIVSDRPRIGEGDPDDPYWLDVSERQKERPYVGVSLVFLDPPILRAELKEDAGFGQSEVIRMPQMANPLVLRTDDVELIDAFLEEYTGVPVLRKPPAWGMPRRRDAMIGQ
jgi:predicted RNA-binding protein with PUA-like domain